MKVNTARTVKQNKVNFGTSAWPRVVVRERGKQKKKNIRKTFGQLLNLFTNLHKMHKKLEVGETKTAVVTKKQMYKRIVGIRKYLQSYL